MQMPFPQPTPVPQRPLVPPHLGWRDALNFYFPATPMPEVPGALPQVSRPPMPLSLPPPGLGATNPVADLGGGGSGLGSLMSERPAGTAGNPWSSAWDYGAGLLGGGAADPIAEAMSAPLPPNPLAEGGFEAIRDRAKEMADLLGRLYPTQGQAPRPSAPRAGPLRYDPTKTPSEPPAGRSPSRRGGGVLLPAVDMTSVRRREALAEPSAKGVPSAQPTGTEAEDFMLKALTLPLKIPMFIRNALQKTVGSVIHGGDPGWLNQGRVALDGARDDIMRADAERQRLEAHLKATLPPEEWARVRPQFQNLTDFMSARQGGDKAKGLPGKAPDGIASKIGGVFEFMTRSYEDEGNELAAEIMKKRSAAAEQRDALAEIRDQYSTGAMADRLQFGLDSRFSEAERLQGLERGQLGMDWMRHNMAGGGEGAGSGGISPSLEWQIRKFGITQEQNEMERAAKEQSDNERLANEAMFKAGRFAKADDDYRKAELERVGYEVPLTKSYLGGLIGGNPDFAKAKPKGLRPTSGKDAAFVAELMSMEPDEAVEAIFQAEETGQIDTATGRRLLAEFGEAPR